MSEVCEREPGRGLKNEARRSHTRAHTHTHTRKSKNLDALLELEFAFFYIYKMDGVLVDG